MHGCSNYEIQLYPDLNFLKILVIHSMWAKIELDYENNMQMSTLVIDDIISKFLNI